MLPGYPRPEATNLAALSGALQNSHPSDDVFVIGVGYKQQDDVVARYFFDIHNGDEFFRDPEGCECADAKSIRQEAMRTLPEIARHTIPTRMADTQALTILVRDKAGATVYTATLSFAGLWLNEPAGA